MKIVSAPALLVALTAVAQAQLVVPGVTHLENTVTNGNITHEVHECSKIVPERVPDKNATTTNLPRRRNEPGPKLPFGIAFCNNNPDCAPNPCFPEGRLQAMQNAILFDGHVQKEGFGMTAVFTSGQRIVCLDHHCAYFMEIVTPHSLSEVYDMMETLKTNQLCDECAIMTTMEQPQNVTSLFKIDFIKEELGGTNGCEVCIPSVLRGGQH